MAAQSATDGVVVRPIGATVITLDELDREILRVLDTDPRLPTAAIAEKLRCARRTVQVRLERFEQRGLLRQNSARIHPSAIGFNQSAYVNAEVDQAELQAAVASLASIPQVLHVAAVAGEWDLLCEVVARDSDDLFELGQRILSISGIRRTTTSLVLRDLLPFRAHLLLR